MRRYAALLAFTFALGALFLYACGLEQAGQLAGGTDGSVDDVVEASVPDVVVLPDADPDVRDAGPPDVVQPVSPGDVPALAFWVRADLGVDFVDGGDSGVAAWRDLADAGPHDLSPAAPPAFEAAPPGYGGKPGIRFGTNDGTRLFNSTLTIAQPFTVMMVGHASTDISYFLDSTSPTRASLLTTTGKSLALYTSTGSYAPPSGAGKVDVPTVIVATFNGSNSSLHLSSNTPRKNLNPGNAGLGGISVGAYQNSVYGLGGVLAEVAIWQGTVDSSNIVRLNAYAEKRYGIVISP
jgi:hypothetical protein